MSESVSLSPELLFIRDASSLNASAGNEVPPDAQSGPMRLRQLSMM